MQAITKIEQMPLPYPPDQIQLLKNTICKGITDNDFMIFSHVCKRTGLDPFARQIYAVPRKGVMTIQTGIDGYRLIAERTGRYSPGKEPSYAYDSNGKLLSSTAYVKKMTADGTWHEVSATAFYSEYVQIFNGGPSQFWAKMPHGQLAKCAEALALRKSFPQEMSGIYTKDEMDQADSTDLPQADVQEVPKKLLIKLVTKDQADLLALELKKCSKDFNDKLSNLMKEREIKSYNELSEKFYATVMKGVVKDQADNAVCELEVTNEA